MIRKLILWMVAFMGVHAQAQFAGGLSAGLNFCQIDGDTFGGYGKIGPSLGGFVYYQLNERLALQTEILYSVKGARVASFSHHIRLRYFDWPILLNFTLVGNGEQSVVLQGGFSTGYLIFAKSGLNIFDDVTDEYRHIDVNVLAGATLKATRNFSIVSRWGYSLFDINSLANPSTSAKLANKYITIALRWEWNKSGSNP